MNNTQKNKRLLKDQIVETPLVVAEYIYSDLKRKQLNKILDIGCYKGNLSKPFRKKKNTQIVGLDVEDKYKNSFDYFLHKDFLQTTKKDFTEHKIDLILCNPPFSQSKQENELYPLLFLRKIYEIWGKNIPVILIVPNYFLTNSKRRMGELNSYNITKNTFVHKSVFNSTNKDIFVECNILYFNIKTKKQIDFISLNSLKPPKKRHYKAISLTEEQHEFLNKNISNFNKYIKGLIKKDNPQFPF